jgi:SAM-dependent methyltransferase
MRRERLEDLGEGLLLAEQGVPLPTVVELDGVMYERFMDRILLPVPVELLTRHQLTVMNRARQRLLAEGAGAINNTVKNSMVEVVRRLNPDGVLEWGCGYTGISDELPTASYVAADADPQVVAALRRRNVPCLDAVSELDTLPVHGFDLIVSVFVFHFHISPDQIGAMASALRPSGVLLANVYRRTEESRSILQGAFEAFGFVVSRRPDPHALCDHHEYWAASTGRSGEDLNEILSWF